MNPQTKDRGARFAVKRKGDLPKVAPVLVCVAQSFDDAIAIASHKNERMGRPLDNGPFYATVIHG
jgi:hypothetical protein